jgi:hypothetical protein
MLCLLPDFGKRENVAAVHRLYNGAKSLLAIHGERQMARR